MTRGRSQRDPSSYEIGYAKPPQSTRFRVGQSGNPNGRPKGSRSVGAVLQAIINQRVTVSENGRTRRIRAIEIMFRRLANDAMRSDPRALKLLLSLVDRYGESQEAPLGAGALVSEDQAILSQYLQSLPLAPLAPDGEDGTPGPTTESDDAG